MSMPEEHHRKDKPKVSLVITDLDNTLYDWVAMWSRAFKAMLSVLVDQSGVSEETLIGDFHTVFQKHDTSEYAFAIEELPSLRSKFPNENLAEKFRDAIAAYKKARKEALRLYPEVLDTLNAIRAKGCRLVGYTESMGFYTAQRVRSLELDGVLDYVYCPRDHRVPLSLTRDQVRRYPDEYYELKHTVQRWTPRGVKKPNKQVLLSIIRQVNADMNETIYVGDNLMKDMLMAQAANVIDVHAKYGIAQDRPEYELLRRVTHWSSDEVEREKRTKESDVRPSYTLTRDFGQLLKLFQFKRFIKPIMRASRSQKQELMDIWKKTIDVQQHFNDLELRIRNYAVTLTVAIIGAAALIERERISVTVLGRTFALAGFVVFSGIVAWFAFYVMDRLWYHRLLYGSVSHGSYIEARARRVLPELGLTDAISRASPLRPLGLFEIHSTAKIDLFYGLCGVGLIVVMVALFLLN
jgi:phosphoglycolate phosphatase-like HAD superfamily hydrolase